MYRPPPSCETGLGCFCRADKQLGYLAVEEEMYCLVVYVCKLLLEQTVVHQETTIVQLS